MGVASTNNGQRIEYISHFNFLGWDVSYVFNNYITNKLHRFQLMCATIYRTLRNKTAGEIKLKLYKVMANTGADTWPLLKQDVAY